MLAKNEIYQRDISFVADNLDAKKLRKKRILITGASGMICSCLIDVLMELNRRGNEIMIFASARNIGCLQDRFSSYAEGQWLRLLQWDVVATPNFDFKVDYVIHGASNADPVSFLKYPVETLLANVLGTRNLLNYSIAHGMERFVYLSSGEMYGQPDEKMSEFTEDYCGRVDYASSRACYPAGKRAAEVLCQSYISQHGVDAVIARPCHIFGPTMTRSDSRAVSEFLRNAARGQDIVLKSAGTIERSHCYSVDAAGAIMCILQKGVCGAAYNIADEQYQMTIREFAEQVAWAAGRHVIFENPSDMEQRGYSTVNRAVLDSAKLRTLGWKPQCDSISGVAKTVQILRQL